MKIIFVRHGHPNYALDCLTELGHEQAEKAAQRLMSEKIDVIYASSCGRAYETALHTAKLLSMDVIKLDFMKEIRWDPTDGNELYHNGHPWELADHAVSLGLSLTDESWTKTPPYCESHAHECVEKVSQGIDKWLESLGYRREGTGYRVIDDNTDKTIALFSHGGSSSAALSHLLNLPFYFVCGTIRFGFTSISVITFSDEKGMLITPKIDYLNDTGHIKTEKATFSN